ncbi:MAG: class C sortase [Christensenella sp.]|nr:class C sortase [Christensenella sp.]
MKKLLPNLLLAAVFLAGLTLLLYPTISNYVNERHQSHVVSTYESDLAQLPQEDYGPMLQAAEAYNVELAKNPDRFLQTDEDDAKYQAQLNPTLNGIMGFVEIDAIRVKLPIYHGTDESVLQVGVGHVEGTSLPVGGTGTHSAISGHRGLPSAMLFTDLDKLKVGDTFRIHTLDRVLTYRIDQILVVEPSDLTALEIDPALDYCTLVTCTPYGINSHRLMLRGVRTQNASEPAATVPISTEEPEAYASTAALVAIGVLILAAILLTRSLIRSRQENRS